MIEILYLSDWRQHKSVETAYTTTPTNETMAEAHIGSRFVTVQAHDGDLVISIGTESKLPSPANTGSLRILKGYRTFQVPRVREKLVISIASATGTVNGSIVWGF